MLALGEYTVQEKTPSIGYLADPQIYTVLLSKQVGESIVVVKSKEQVITNQIEFMKVYNEGESGTLLPEEGITFEIPDATTVVVRGIDKELVGDVAADIRAWRKPEPYKGKGIKYSDEVIRRKEGKTGK